MFCPVSVFFFCLPSFMYCSVSPLHTLTPAKPGMRGKKKEGSTLTV